MATDDKCVSIHPYFKVPEEKMAEFREYCQRFVAMSQTEPGCLYYGFSFKDDICYCREAYADGDAVLAHLENVGAAVAEVLKISELVKIEVHGPEVELAKVREPMAGLEPDFYVLEYGFKR